MTCKAATPPGLGLLAFYDVPTKTGTLYVPSGSISAYQNALNWNTWGTISAIPELTNVTLSDATAYTNGADATNQQISYTRTFNNTNWQALYVPFEMEYSDWNENFEIAQIVNFHQYDQDGDGQYETTKLEIQKLTAGSNTYANYPYLIKAKTQGTHTITPTGTTLYRAEERSIDCSSVLYKYTFTGTYSGRTIRPGAQEYALANGQLNPPSGNVTLSPMRWYLNIEARPGGSYALPQQISLFLPGKEEEEIEDMTTSIIDTTPAKMTPYIYTIDGRILSGEVLIDQLPAGIYIIQGEKVLIRK